MTFYSIPNTRRFLERVRTCSGEVRYLDSDGRVLDLKAAAVALTDTGLERFVGPIDKIEVFTQRAEDAVRLIRFMAEMAVPASWRQGGAEGEKRG